MHAADTARAPASLGEIADRVEARLRALLDVERARWTAVDADLDAPIACLSHLVLGGGKRLRPAFCHWAFVGAGGDPSDPIAVDAGAGFELLHAFALVHDDVMDGSDRRRGADTAHRTFQTIHESAGWRGEGRRFGEGVAILVGDLAFVYADLLLADAPREARDIYDELRVELNIGQYLDVLGTARGGVGLPTARRIASYKSGRYTVERPLHVGAALAGRFAELEAPLSAYGDPLGEAFQLRDDVLGAFGDSEATGKPVGDDLREGKPTPILAVALERATGSALAVLDRVGDAELTEADIAALQQVIVDTGALAEAEARIDELTGVAIRAAEGAPLVPEARVALCELATYIATRDR
ncbi:MAG: polyprenyl synthetase family protein [Acidimicrobiales bacterium]